MSCTEFLIQLILGTGDRINDLKTVGLNWKYRVPQSTIMFNFEYYNFTLPYLKKSYGKLYCYPPFSTNGTK